MTQTQSAPIASATRARPSLLVIAAASRRAASTRHRLWNYRDALERDFAPLRWVEYGGGGGGWSPRAVAARAACACKAWQGAAASQVVLIQKLLFPGAVVRAWKAAGKRIVYDFDDALYARAPNGESSAVARARRRRLDATLETAHQVVAGSEPLRRYAAQRNPQVQVVHPSLDANAFHDFPRPRNQVSGQFRVGWIGHEMNLGYLESLSDAFCALADDVPGLRIVVCSGRPPQLAEALSERVRFVPWSEENEIAALRDMDAAVSPMGADEWSRGRGGRVSVLNCMAAGLPVVLTPGGGIEDMVGDGTSALFATSPDDFAARLRRLAQKPAYGAQIGKAARAVIDGRIWSHVQYPRFRAAIAGARPGAVRPYESSSVL